MSASPKRRNKPYRPRAVQADPVSWAIAGVHTLPLAAQHEMIAPLQAAVALLKTGRAGRDDWNALVQALAMAVALAGLQIGPNLLPQIEAGRTALDAIGQRMAARGTATCYGAELAALDEALAMYRAQVRLCTQAELARAHARVKQLHASGAMDGVARLYEQMAKAA